MGSCHVIPLRVREDLKVMATKGSLLTLLVPDAF